MKQWKSSIGSLCTGGFRISSFTVYQIAVIFFIQHSFNDCHSFNDLTIHLLTRCIWLSIIFNLQVFATSPCPALPPGSALPSRRPTTCRRFARYKMCMWLSAIVPFIAECMWLSAIVPFVAECMWLSAIVPFYLLQVLETSPCRGGAAKI